MLHSLGTSLFLGITCTHKNTDELCGIEIAEHNPEHYSYRNSKDGTERPPQPSPECQCQKDKHRAQVQIASLDTRLYQVTMSCWIPKLSRKIKVGRKTSG